MTNDENIPEEIKQAFESIKSSLHELSGAGLVERTRKNLSELPVVRPVGKHVPIVGTAIILSAVAGVGFLLSKHKGFQSWCDQIDARRNQESSRATAR